LDHQISFDPELDSEMAIDTCVENFYRAVLKALASSNPKCGQRADTLPPIPTDIQDEIA